MFTKSAAYYDAIYSFKDYASEAAWIDQLIESRMGPGEQRSILDVACGTGVHISHLRPKYEVMGIDKERALIRIAQERNPGVSIEYGDMAGFDLGRHFDVVTCLFSSIGYVALLPKLQRTVANFAKHVRPGGLVIVEPWLTPDKFTDRYFGTDVSEGEAFKIARASHSRNLGTRSVTRFEYLISSGGGIEHVVEEHELGLFTDSEYLDAFQRAGLEVERLEDGLMGRGVYVGAKPL